VGKTSLLFKLQTILERKAIPCAVVDLTTLQNVDTALNVSQPTFGKERDIASSWYNLLAAQLHSQLKMSGPAVYRDKTVYDSSSFISFLNNLEVVADPKMRAVIMFDEAAAIPPSLKNHFFSRLRALFNSRSGSKPEPATRFDFVFAGAFYPSALITSPAISPFNVSVEVRVPDFQRHEVDKLLQGFTQLHLDLEKEAADEIWNAARGHPFLTQKICQNLAYSSKQHIRLEDVNGQVNDILHHDAHLQNLVRRLDENPAEVELIRKVVVQREKISVNPNVSPLAAQLEMIGALTVGSDGFARVRNGIYGRLLRNYLADRTK
jgi:hypothetical protein